jgi:hypothetical protein
MDEIKQNIDNQEINKQEESIVESEQVIEENIDNTDKKEEPFKYNKEEVNIARLREAKIKAEKEKAELAIKLVELQKQQQTTQEQREYGDDDFIEGKHLKKEIQDLKTQIESFKVQQKAQSDETRLKHTYNDFDKVVNKENIEKLKEIDPETAETIANSNASLYARGSAAYKRIKELGIISEDVFIDQKQKANSNASKPRPVNSISPQQGDSPLSMANAFANGLTDDLKKQLWKEMQESAKRI